MAIRIIILMSCLLLGAQEQSNQLQKIDLLYQNRSMKELIPQASSLLDSPTLSLREKSRLRLYLGEAFISIGQPQEAIKHLLEVDRTDPNTPDRLNAYLKLKELYKTDPARYQSYLEKIFTSFPKSPQAIAAGKELATILIKSKTYSQAVDVLGTLFKLWKVDDTDGILQMQLATAYVGLRDYVEAADYIQAVEKINKEFLLKNPDYILTSARVNYSSQRFDQAIALLTRLINVYPNSPQVLDAALLLAQSYDRSQNPFLGAVTLIQAIKNRTAGTSRYDLTLLLGQLLSQLPQTDLEQLDRAYPGMADSNQLLRQVYDEAQELDLKRQASQILARILRESNKPEQAVAICLDYLSKNRESAAFKLLRDSIDDWLAKIASTEDLESLRALWTMFHNKKSFLSGSNLINLARQLTRHKLFQAAEEVQAHIRRYRMYEAYWAEAQEHQIDLLLKVKRFDEARKELADAQNQVQNESRFRWFSWQLAVETGADDKEIDRILSDLPPLEPSNRHSRDLHLTDIDRMIDKKEFASAQAKLQAIAEHPDISPDLQLELTRRFALLAFHQGDLERALKLYSTLANISKEEPWALFRKISILRQLGREKEAELLAAQLKKRHPDSFWSRQIR